MPNMPIAEGTPAVRQGERAGFSIPSNLSLCATADSATSTSLLLHWT